MVKLENLTEIKRNVKIWNRPSENHAEVASEPGAVRHSANTTISNDSILERLTFALLWVFVFTVPFEKMLMLDAFGSISRLIGMILMPVGVLAIVARGRFRHLTAMHWFMVAYVFWGGLTYLWTFRPELTSDRVLTEFQLLLVVVVMWQFCTSREGALRLTKAYICGTLVSCGGTIYRFASHQTTRYQRYAAGGFDPNDLSLALAVSIPLSYYFFLRSDRGRGLGWLLQIGMVTLTCVLTASRMGAVVTVVALVIVPLTAAYLDKKRRAALIAAVLLAIIATIAIVPASSWKRLATIGTEVQHGDMNLRTVIWESAMKAFSERPVAGLGAGAFEAGVPPMMSYFDDKNAYVAHNTYLSVLTERGLIGLLLFTLLLGSVVAAACRIRPPLMRNTWLIAFLVWALGAATLTYEHRKPTWMVFALIVQSAGWLVVRLEP